MNVLIIGNNPKHAKLFSMFADEVYILLQRENNGINRVSQELFDYKLLYSDVSYGGIKYSINRNKEIKKIVVDKKIDIVFSNRRDDMIQSKIATIGMNNRPLLLVTFHNSTAWVNDYKVRLVSRLINVCTDGCVCLASFMHKKLLNNGIGENKLLFLPNTIQHENFVVKEDYAIHSKVVKICYTAVVYPLKNQKIIIEVINLLKDKYKFDVHLYGDFLDEKYATELQNLIKKYGLEKDIHLDGRIDNSELRKLLPLNDIYLSSTTIEMSPYNILEAKASGLPVVASNVVGQRDLIEDGIDGVLYDINDVNDLKIKLEMIIDNLEMRKRLGTTARERVSTSKSYFEAAKKLEHFIRNIK